MCGLRDRGQAAWVQSGSGSLNWVTLPFKQLLVTALKIRAPTTPIQWRDRTIIRKKWDVINSMPPMEDWSLEAKMEEMGWNDLSEQSCILWVLGGSGHLIGYCNLHCFWPSLNDCPLTSTFRLRSLVAFFLLPGNYCFNKIETSDCFSPLEIFQWFQLKFQVSEVCF